MKNKCQHLGPELKAILNMTADLKKQAVEIEGLVTEREDLSARLQVIKKIHAH